MSICKVITVYYEELTLLRRYATSYVAIKCICMVAYFCPMCESYFSIKYVHMQDEYVDMQGSYMSTCNINMLTRKKITII